MCVVFFFCFVFFFREGGFKEITLRIYLMLSLSLSPFFFFFFFPNYLNFGSLANIKFCISDGACCQPTQPKNWLRSSKLRGANSGMRQSPGSVMCTLELSCPVGQKTVNLWVPSFNVKNNLNLSFTVFFVFCFFFHNLVTFFILLLSSILFFFEYIYWVVSNWIWESPYGIVANMINCDTIVSKFKL